jgi:hypothetical protein
MILKKLNFLKMELRNQKMKAVSLVELKDGIHLKLQNSIRFQFIQMFGVLAMFYFLFFQVKYLTGI